MSPETKKRAHEKLAKFTVKIGYPNKWRDYTTLQIVKGDLVGNVIRAETFEYNRNLNKLGKPIDRDEWGMTPQTVNAYYSPEKNEIVFPAAILHPPFFNPLADDAVNYGGIGGVIGHEISHGFDDQGSQYDGDGNLLGKPGWFTQADQDRFSAKTHALVEQYAAYEPVPGFPVNGELTLGENIADNSGVAIAYKAYKLSLAGKEAPVLDGLTGNQRFFSGWAQVWREKIRDETLIMQIKSDPHSPEQLRGTVPEMNMASFYAAFDVKEGRQNVHRAGQARHDLVIAVVGLVEANRASVVPRQWPLSSPLKGSRIRVPDFRYLPIAYVGKPLITTRCGQSRFSIADARRSITESPRLRAAAPTAGS